MKGETKKLSILVVLVFSSLLTCISTVSPAKGNINDVTLGLSQEVRAEPLSTNDSVFGVCYLPPTPSLTHARGLNWRRLDCHWSTVEPTDDNWCRCVSGFSKRDVDSVTMVRQPKRCFPANDHSTCFTYDKASSRCSTSLHRRFSCGLASVVHFPRLTEWRSLTT